MNFKEGEFFNTDWGKKNLSPPPHLFKERNNSPRMKQDKAGEMGRFCHVYDPCKRI